MKSWTTPKQYLARDRARKTIYREALRAQGWRAHTIWIRDESWAEAVAVLHKHGLLLRGSRAAKAIETREAVNSDAARVGSIAVPQHTQPDTKEGQ